MSFIRKAILPQPWKPLVQLVRHKGNRINIQRPKKPHYERAKVMAVCQPIFPKPENQLPMHLTCEKLKELQKSVDVPENQYERLIARELMNWLNHSRLVAFVHTNPLSSEERFRINILLKKQNMIWKFYGRNTFKMAVENTAYEAALHLFQSHNSIIFSIDPQVRQLLKALKKAPQLVLMAGVLEGQFLSKNELVEYSKLPDPQTARSGLVSVLNSAAGQVVQHLTQHQQILVGHLDKRVELLKEEEATSL